MNQAQAAELLESLGEILRTLVRIEKLLTEAFGPPVRRENHKRAGMQLLDENSVAGSFGRGLG